MISWNQKGNAHGSAMKYMSVTPVQKEALYNMKELCIMRKKLCVSEKFSVK